MNDTKKRAMLVILDGWGNAPAGPGNAITSARTPVFEEMMRTHPHTELTAHGRRVGLPDDDQMGNSEVGHLNLGAGRVVKQDLTLINDALTAGLFAKNPVFAEAAEKIKAAGGRAHVMGLCSPGGVHSSLEHLYALVDLLHGAGLTVYLHAITDGRDTPPSSARGYLATIEERLAGKAKVSVVVGRYWSMDRDKRWDRVERGYKAHVRGEGETHATVDEAVGAAYAAGQTDEFIHPRIVAPEGVIRDGDGVFFFNFRADRAREMTRALTEDGFADFDVSDRPKLSSYVCMTEYQADFGLPVAFKPHEMKNILGEVISNAGLSQFRCAETEKYAHVTFFFNGGVEAPFPGEERKLVPSPKEVATYDEKPQMSAGQVADAVVERIESGDDEFILVNFANPDMVGHTGIFDAAVAAVEEVDAQLGRLRDAAAKAGLSMLVTADHGNSEQMLDAAGEEPHTAHTLNPVPLIAIPAPGVQAVPLRAGGALEDVAPTVLSLLDLPVPAEMTGKSLLAEGS